MYFSITNLNQLFVITLEKHGTADVPEVKEESEKENAVDEEGPQIKVDVKDFQLMSDTSTA